MTHVIINRLNVFSCVRHLNLRTKMKALLSLVVLGCAALGLGYWAALKALDGADQQRATIDDTASAITQFRVGLLQQRRYEKEFLLRKLQKYVDQHHLGAERSRQGLARYKDLVDDTIDGSIATRLQRNFKLYQQGFKNLVAARVAVGINEKSGALGKLRNAVHRAEATLKQHDNMRLGFSMLMMRRHEKDFLARNKPKYVKEMADESRVFNTVLDSAMLGAATKKTIRTDMAIYQREFAFLVKQTQLLNVAYQASKQAAHALEKDLSDAVTRTTQEHTAALALQVARHAEVNRWFMSGLGLFTIALITLLTLMARGILTQLGADPSTLATAVSRIAEGDLETAFDVPANDNRSVLFAIDSMRRQLRAMIATDLPRIVSAARGGDLGQRIDLSNKRGCFAELGEGINELVNVSGAVVEDSSKIFAAMARGDLGEHIERDYQGAFAQLRDDANATVDRLQTVIGGDVRNLATAANCGDLSQRIDTTGYAGFFLDLGDQLNALMETTEQALGDAVRVFQALARGDLTERIKGNYQGLFDELKYNSNDTVDKLHEVVAQIGAAAAEVKQGAVEISEGNTNLSNRTEKQAANLEKTASAMHQMTSTVEQNADYARQANQLTDDTCSEAERGGTVANNAVQAVAEISAASKKIADIIGVIDEIAFQTNLLALNASVEAARAGEQGRGFAVVASEVRNLAGRSAAAAKEIKGLIEDSVSKVDDGQRLVKETGQVLGTIVGSVKKVNTIVAEIAAASGEQTKDIVMINQAVSQIDEMTQRNTALVEEAAAASHKVGDQAHQLNALVGYFKVGTSMAQTTAPQAVAANRRTA